MRVVVLITQRSRVQIPPPLPSTAQVRALGWVTPGLFCLQMCTDLFCLQMCTDLCTGFSAQA